MGLATGHQLLQKNPHAAVTILEKEPTLARHQTGHNSGVIHSGIYYKPGSLKAKNCRRGAGLLLDFCRKQEIPYEMCGKVIVATSSAELPALDLLYERGVANGVEDMELIGPERLRELEPYSAGLKAIHSPNTGIVDYGQVAGKLANLILASGGKIHKNTQALNMVLNPGGMTIETTTGAYTANKIINCAGLFSDRVAELSGVPPSLRIVPFRGEYYVLNQSGRYLVKNLIYPVPDPRYPFLGVHFTRGMDGRVEAGPNAVLALAREGYKKTDIHLRDMWDYLSYGGFWSMAGKYWKTALGEYYRSYFKPAFVQALQKLVPEIRGAHLEPGGSGVRAQALTVDGKLVDDFFITGNDRVINVLNTPSPAATSSLAIGEYIAALVSD